MDNKIIIAADEAIVCPKCGHGFPLDAGITRQTIDRYAGELDEQLTELRKSMESQVERELERKLAKQHAEHVAKLQEQLSDSKKAEREAKELIAKASSDAKAKAAEDYALEKKALADEIAEKDRKLGEFRSQELELRKQKQALEAQQANLELDLQRKLDEAKKQLSEQIAQKEADRFAMIEAEYKKKIEDAQRANEDLRRKLDQGSQQLQGEVLELELEHALQTAFHQDLIEEVKKGVRGADVIQTVRTPAGQTCGKIIWEAKRAENWSDKWLQKLKDDQQEAKADLAVLVTTVMPKGVTEPFVQIGDVWVVSPHVMRPVATMLRVILLDAQRLQLINSGKSEKMELLYNYLSSAQFAQRVRTMLESFESMRSDLEAEKRAMQRIWAKRQSQLDRVTGSMMNVVGELQAIAQDSLPQLDSIAELPFIEDGETAATPEL